MSSDTEALPDPVDVEGQDEAPLNLTNRRIAFVGRLEALNRHDVHQLIRERGAIPVTSLRDADLLVVGMTELPIQDLDQLLSDEQFAGRTSNQKPEVVSENRFWQLLGLVEADSGVKRLYTAAMLASLLNVPLATIRRWHRRGLIVPVQMVHRLAYYDFQEVATARQIAKWLDSGASPLTIEKKLSRLAELFPEVQRPLLQLSVIVEGKDVLLRQGGGLVEPGGQRRMDFAALDAPGPSADPLDEPPSRRIRAVDADELLTPEQHRQLASELEDEGKIGDAIQVYRSMLFAFGPQADVHFALAELLYLQEDLSAARERYFMTIELDEAFVEARSSLGCLLLETGEPLLAISTLQGALQIHPDYADAHFHLARALEDCGRTADALTHWRRFVDLSPDSPWADEAKQRLSDS